MSAPSSRTFINAAVILGAGLFALGGISRVASLRDAERGVVKRLSLLLDPAESAFGGQGSQAKPWLRWKAKPSVAPEPPRFLAVDADPEGYFSTSPPAPVDCAVLFARLRDAGHRVIGSGYLMAWDEPDSLAVLALHKQLDRFDAAVLGLPLARGAAAEPVPASFLRLSMPAARADGDVSALPQVNRVAVPNAELGGEQTLAGFTLLENEADAGDGRRHLLARWHDRIVFSLPLATEIASLGIDLEEIRVTCGEEIRLGPGRPVIPIDEFGRTPVSSAAASVDIPATAIISEEDPIPPAADPLILRDVRPELPEAEKAWSNQLAGMVQALRSAPRYQPAMVLRRPEPLKELALILLLAFFGTWATRLRRMRWRLITAVLLAGFGAELIWLFAYRLNLWLPPFAVLAPSLAALALAILPTGIADPAPEPEIPAAPLEGPLPEQTLPEPEIAAALPPEPAPEPPAAAKSARKAPASKTGKKRGR